MPTLPLRSCSHPGCAQLIESGKCDEHKRLVWRLIDRQRGTSGERGYDAAHRKLRVLCFERDGWKCVDCGWQPEIVSDFHRFGLGEPPGAKVLEELRINFNAGARHLHADHQIPIDVRPDLRLDLDNMRTRCDKCHNAKTLRELQNGTIGSKAEGQGGDEGATSPRAR